MSVNDTSPVPIYQQIVDQIATAVAAGVYKPGDAIPSVRQQAIAMLVNPNTVQRAYETLERAGVLTVRRGGAPIVANGGHDIAKEKVLDTIRSAFAEGIKAGRAADMVVTQIDQLYHEAWLGILRPEPARTEEEA